jgi:hypothetical protein
MSFGFGVRWCLMVLVVLQFGIWVQHHGTL